MLLIAAALLTASMHSMRVIEAPAAPTVAVRVDVAEVPPDPVLGPEPRAAGPASVDLEALAHARGREFLTDLVAVDPADLARADRDGRVIATAQDRPPTAVDVAAWWGALPAATHDRLVAGAPAVVGNLDGVPYDVRDRANRLTLAREAPGAVGSSGGIDIDADADADAVTDSARTAMLEQVRAALHREPGEAERALVVLDTRGTGRAAIAVGDLGTARDVTVVVPGMFFTVTGQMHDFTDTAGHLYDEQSTVAALAASRTDRSAASSAVVAWMGYRTPDMSNILSLGLAQTGAERLERVVDGLDAVRGDDRPRLNVVAHSYGSTTALMALSSGHMQADSLTVLGSPGSDVRTAQELAVHAGQVYVGDAHSDPIAGSGYFGTDPGSPGFGSTLLDLSADSVARDDGPFRRPEGHNDYLKPGTASLHDVALIAVGRGDLVRHQARRGQDGGDAPRTAPDMYLLRPQDLQPRD
ncbi:alpha/beta hydrolase [Curtobacterium sp. MCSS17_007]|uniref:alpha/beta hydrolase n=1 Tax=Curtobacterium sp. MCSS17_007 TaxID=2175646 RepID=UPI000DAA9A7D|nr:alpha/beta hydrolase [Curtobacterium sp. MCSS17_007]WIE76489.1 alpha/beta hydrolase [Curtobacterium sp. MCSS17_007]